MLTSLRINVEVIAALMHRDMRARFGGNKFGFLLSVLRPIGHLFVIMTIYYFAKRVAPLGTDSRVFFATGIAPYVLFSYPARQTILSIVAYKPLLYFPRVKIVDLIVATALAEVLGACVAAVVMLVGLISVGIDFDPADPAVFVSGLLSAVLFGISYGAIGSIAASFAPAVAFALNITMSVWYIVSGIIFFPDYMPLTVLQYLMYDPLLQIVELTRIGYYGNIQSEILMPLYPVIVSCALLLASLILERTLRGRILTR